MALVQKKNSRQNMLLLVLLAVVIVGGGATYWFLRPTTGPTDSSTGGLSSRDPEIFTDFGQDLYSTPQYRALHDFTKDIPPVETTTVPIPVPIPNLDDQVDLPPNTKIGNPEPFKL
ncbi:MAG: hypothetical protein HY976_03165 [Candidatus Kerfeldbacteria bacterium]|nr:hypothetical protein [Candidatus Kerfeldbacteria bacterium]